MTFTNQGNTSSSGGGGQITFSEGALLTPSAGVITPTDSFHHVAAGTISSIATTNFDANTSHFLVLEADGAITFTAGASLVVNTTTLASGCSVLFKIEGTVATQVGEPPFTMTKCTDVAFSAGNFTADTGTWTVASGDQLSYFYKIVDDAILVSVELNTTTVSGSPNQLRIAIPASKTCKTRTAGPVAATDNGTAAHANFVVITTGGNNTFIQVTRADGATWGNSTDNTRVRLQAWIPIS